jgi:hypothetical protein
MNKQTTNTQRLRRQAYIDGQLSVDEVIAFQDELSAQERKEVDQEMAFEQAFSNHLQHADATDCPPELWHDLQNRILRDDPEGIAPSTDVDTPSLPNQHPARALWFVQAIAAAAAIAIAAFLLTRNTATPPSTTAVAMALPTDLTAFASEAKLQGDVVKIREALATTAFSDINILAPSTEDHHAIKFLGMNQETIDGEPAVRLFISCCNRPATILLTHADTKSLQFDDKDLPKQVYRAEKPVGQNHRITILSPHTVDAVLNLFS